MLFHYISRQINIFNVLEACYIFYLVASDGHIDMSPVGQGFWHPDLLIPCYFPPTQNRLKIVNFMDPDPGPT